MTTQTGMSGLCYVYAYMPCCYWTAAIKMTSLACYCIGVTCNVDYCYDINVVLSVSPRHQDGGISMTAPWSIKR